MVFDFDFHIYSHLTMKPALDCPVDIYSMMSCCIWVENVCLLLLHMKCMFCLYFMALFSFNIFSSIIFLSLDSSVELNRKHFPYPHGSIDISWSFSTPEHTWDLRLFTWWLLTNLTSKDPLFNISAFFIICSNAYMLVNSCRLSRP